MTAIVPFWSARCLQLVQRLRRPVGLRVGGVGRGERRASVRRVDELAEQRVVTAVDEDRSAREGRVVSRRVLRGLPACGDQVLADHVVALVLVDQGEVTRGLAGLAIGRRASGRDTELPVGDVRVGGPVEGHRVAGRHLSDERLAEGVDALAPDGAGTSKVQVGAVEADADLHHRAGRDGRRHGRHCGLGARGDHERAVDRQLPARCQDRRLDERALRARVGHRAAVAELPRRRQAGRAKRVGRDAKRAVHRGRGLRRGLPGVDRRAGAVDWPCRDVSELGGGDRAARERVGGRHRGSRAGARAWARAGGCASARRARCRCRGRRRWPLMVPGERRVRHVDRPAVYRDDRRSDRDASRYRNGDHGRYTSATLTSRALTHCVPLAGEHSFTSVSALTVRSECR